MIVDDNTDPLPNKPKGMGKKTQAYSQEELDGLDKGMPTIPQENTPKGEKR